MDESSDPYSNSKDFGNHNYNHSNNNNENSGMQHYLSQEIEEHDLHHFKNVQLSDGIVDIDWKNNVMLVSSNQGRIHYFKTDFTNNQLHMDSKPTHIFNQNLNKVKQNKNTYTY